MDATVPFVIIIFCALANASILFRLYAFLARRGRAAAFLGMVFVATLGIEYCLRPLQIVSSHEFGWEPSIVRSLDTINPDALALASVLSLAGVGAFAMSVVLPWSSNAMRRAPSSLLSSSEDAGTSSIRVSLGITSLVAILLSGAVALQLGRIGGSFAGEFGRQNIGSGYVYLFVNLAGISALVALASLPLRSLARWRTILTLSVSYIAFVAIHSFILGGRAEVIIVTIAALVVTTARLGRPRMPALVVILVCAVLASGLYRVVTRDPVSLSAGTPRLSLALSSLQDPLALVTRYDVSAYDKLVLLELNPPELRNGSTYLAALLAPIPGTEGLAPEGGNRQFTRDFIPTRYRRAVTYEGISMLGEARYNFGWVGPPIAAGFAGYMYGFFVRRAREDRRWLLILAMAAGVFPSLIRADALNTAALGVSLTIFALLVSAVMTRNGQALSKVVTTQGTLRSDTRRRDY